MLVDKYPTKFEEDYMIKTVSFAREILLDPAECDSAFFVLPQLTRDSFRKKGLFYRIEKIIIENNSSFF